MESQRSLLFIALMVVSYLLFQQWQLDNAPVIEQPIITQSIESGADSTGDFIPESSDSASPAINKTISSAKIIEISSYHTLLSCIAAGMGVGIVPKILLDYYPFAKSIQQHTLAKDWRFSTTAMIWRKDSLKPSMSAFRDFI